MKNNKRRLVGKKYIFKNNEFGEYNDGFKNGRPAYILRAINNDYVFLVISTGTKHMGQKNTFQDKKYIKWNKNSYLRLDYQNGWWIYKKNEIKTDKLIDVNLSKEDRDKLLKFYKSTIDEQKKKLK